MDTLWMDTPDHLGNELDELVRRHAYFAMALETTDKNGNASWYKGGKPAVEV